MVRHPGRKQITTKTVIRYLFSVKFLIAISEYQPGSRPTRTASRTKANHNLALIVLLLKQPLIPYFISSHPGCEEEDMANLAAETKDLGFRLEQVQDFTPTPMTVAEVIYYAGVHPYTLQPIKTPKTKEEKLTQNKYFFWYKPEVKGWIKSRLMKLGRPDLAERLLSYPKKEMVDAPQKEKSIDIKTKKKKGWA